jgi:hypothetical protein
VRKLKGFSVQLTPGQVAYINNELEPLEAAGVRYCVVGQTRTNLDVAGDTVQFAVLDEAAFTAINRVITKMKPAKQP